MKNAANKIQPEMNNVNLFQNERLEIIIEKMLYEKIRRNRIENWNLV